MITGLFSPNLQAPTLEQMARRDDIERAGAAASSLEGKATGNAGAVADACRRHRRYRSNYVEATAEEPMARGGRTAPRVDPRLDPTLRVGAGEAPDGEVCATADETDEAGCKPPAGDALVPGCAAVAEPSAAARMNCDARVDESSARRAEALRVAFAQGSSVWLLEDGMEPDNLLPSQLLIHGRELFVSKSLCVLARFPFLLSLRRWLCSSTATRSRRAAPR